MAKKETKTTAETGSAEYTALQSEAMEAYGIDPEYVIGSAEYPELDLAVLVTAGGKKVRYRSGEKVGKLSRADITGEVK